MKTRVKRMLSACLLFLLVFSLLLSLITAYAESGEPDKENLSETAGQQINYDETYKTNGSTQDDNSSVDDYISISENFNIHCSSENITTGEPSNDLTPYFENLYPNGIKEGYLDKIFPISIKDLGEHDHMYSVAHIGKTPVYYVGVINVDGEKRVFYRTSRQSSGQVTYSVLKQGEKIEVEYIHATAHKISYELILKNGTESDLTPESVFGADGVNGVSDNGSFSFTANIPRGYKAQITVTDEDGNVLTTSGDSERLGQMLVYERSGNKINLSSDSASATLLSGKYTVNNVLSDVTVTAYIEKINEYVFDASMWLQTVYAKGRTSNDEAKQTFTGNSFTWNFKSIKSAGAIWELDQLKINGQMIEVPMTNLSSGELNEYTTTLSTGTVVKLSVISDSDSGALFQRNYTLEISNCYENITVSGGNLIGNAHKEIVMHSLYGVSDSQFFTSSATNPSWSTLTQDSLINRKNAGYYADPIRFKRATGFDVPDVYVASKDGKSYLQKNEQSIDQNTYIEYLIYTGEQDSPELDSSGRYTDANFEVVSYSKWRPSADGYYYFRMSQAVRDYMNTGAQGIILLGINGNPLKTAVKYISAEGEENAPESGNVVNVAGVDVGGKNGYNTATNPVAIITTKIPRDLTGKYVFDHWQAITNEGKEKELATFATGQSIHITTRMYEYLKDCYTYDEEAQRYVITLKAVWRKADLNTPINYMVRYYIDGEEIYSETHSANRGAYIVSDLYDANGKLSKHIINILTGENYENEYYSGTFVVDNENTTLYLKNLDADNNRMYVSLKRIDIDASVKLNWQGISSAAVDRIPVILQKTTDGETWENVGDIIWLNADEDFYYKVKGLDRYTDNDYTTPIEYRFVELYEDMEVKDGAVIKIGSQNEEFLVNYEQTNTSSLFATVITNAKTPTGAVKIIAKTEGSEAEKNRQFHFKLTVTNPDGTPLSGKYGSLEFVDGVSEFTLKHNDSVVAPGLRAGADYSLIQTDADIDGYVTELKNAEGKVINNTSQEILALNTKNLLPAKVNIKARKVVNGDIPKENQVFKFLLKDSMGGIIDTAYNTGSEITFGELEFSSEGVYTYYIVEANSNDENVTYDDTVCKVIITVTQNENKYTAGVEYEKSSTAVSDLPVFSNVVRILHDITASVVWNDGENPENRPGSVKLCLYKDGEKYDEVTVSAEENWTHVWNGLEDGYTWTVDEPDVPEDYEKTVKQNDNVFIIENTAFSQKYISAAVKVEWEDGNDKLRPESVMIQLYKNGEKLGEPVKVSANDDWVYTWQMLPKEGEYSVSQLSVPDGYSTEISKKDNIFIVKNIKQPDKKEDDNKPVIPPKDTATKIPEKSEIKTGDNNLLWLFIGIAAAFALAAAYIAYRLINKFTSINGKHVI